MRKLFFIIALALPACAPSAFAQGGTAAVDGRPGPEVFVGYSNLQAEGIPGNEPNQTGSLDDELFGDREGIHGFNAAVTGFISPRVGITGDFSFHRKSRSFDFQPSPSAPNVRGDVETRVLNFLGGPTVKFRNESRATPFVRALFGVANTRFDVEQTQTGTGGTQTLNFDTGSTDFAMAVGGGLDVRVGNRVDLRVLQFDYNPVFLRDRSIQVLGGAGAIQPFRLEGQRQDNLRFSFGVVFR